MDMHALRLEHMAKGNSRLDTYEIKRHVTRGSYCKTKKVDSH